MLLCCLSPNTITTRLPNRERGQVHFDQLNKTKANHLSKDSVLFTEDTFVLANINVSTNGIFIIIYWLYILQDSFGQLQQLLNNEVQAVCYLYFEGGCNRH